MAENFSEKSSWNKQVRQSVMCKVLLEVQRTGSNIPLNCYAIKSWEFQSQLYSVMLAKRL